LAHAGIRAARVSVHPKPFAAHGAVTGKSSWTRVHDRRTGQLRNPR